MRTRHLVCLLLGLAVLSACGSPATPQPTVQPTVVPEGVPTGFTEDGLPYRGDPNAPVTLYEHSEFQ
jgi:ABC-type uncharacterized transport system auxiliary subunit